MFLIRVSDAYRGAYAKVPANLRGERIVPRSIVPGRTRDRGCRPIGSFRERFAGRLPRNRATDRRPTVILCARPTKNVERTSSLRVPRPRAHVGGEKLGGARDPRTSCHGAAALSHGLPPPNTRRNVYLDLRMSETYLPARQAFLPSLQLRASTVRRFSIPFCADPLRKRSVAQSTISTIPAVESRFHKFHLNRAILAVRSSRLHYRSISYRDTSFLS